MTRLEALRGPDDLRELTYPELAALCAEIRGFLIDRVTRTGGHLGPNLGAVELTVAIHRVFRSPHDPIIWDTGHTAYVHKLLTGRGPGFDRLRQADGLSGYPRRAESVHDMVENSHASTSLSYADGLANAYRLTGQPDRAVVAVVGDGALTGGLAWEGLNNIAAAKDRPLVIVVNDNGRSYAPTVGGFAIHLAALRLSRGYERFLEWGKRTVRGAPIAGGALYETLHRAKDGLKDILVPQSLFEDLGLKYIGPIDGHDLPAVEAALRLARGYRRPAIVHCVTRKGRGYPPAENHEADQMHTVGPAVPRPAAGVTDAGPTSRTFTSIFREEMVTLGAERAGLVGITAAMLEPVGLDAFARAYPDRAFDVGIAEQHAVTSAAGLAMGGLHPVVAIYSTFLNRAFDQVLLDVALHGCAVTLVLDRAGVTGDDGPSHNGMWDLPMLQVVPGLRVAAPRDATRMRQLLREALDVEDGPTALRFPKGASPADVPTLDTFGGLDLLCRSGSQDVLLVAVGVLAETAMETADLLALNGVGATVVDPRWVKPVDPALAQLAARYQLVITVEDGCRAGGIGAAIAQALRDAEVDVPVRNVGLPQRFIEHGTRADILRACGLSAAPIAELAMRTFAGIDPYGDGDAQPAIVAR
jgi:1-deoxy-D-xylulose-5-phosphate synthase